MIKLEITTIIKKINGEEIESKNTYIILNSKNTMPTFKKHEMYNDVIMSIKESITIETKAHKIEKGKYIRIPLFDKSNKYTYAITTDISSLTHIEFNETKDKGYYDISFGIKDTLNDNNYQYKTNKSCIDELLMTLKWYCVN